MTLRFAPLLSGAAVAIGAFAAATAAPPAAGNNPLRVSIVNAPSLAGSATGLVEVAITNTSRKTVRIPSWELPSNQAVSKLFVVMRDGKEVQYEGPMIKRGLPSAADFTILRPGETFRKQVDLSLAYDLTAAGQYTVTFQAPLQHASTSDGAMLKRDNGVPMTAQSVPLQMWVSGASPTLTQEAKASAKPTAGTVVNGITYKSCSSTQISGAGSAVSSARNYSQNARGYLAAGTLGSRYTTWFGAYTSARYSTASQHFVSIDNAIDQTGGQVTINCSCNQSYYAYVYPTRPYEIFVCRAFWSAPVTGTDSKAGTLIHEMSHFNVVAGTDDHVYGQTGAKNLAISDPASALDNADNHEYFAENNPAKN